MNQTGLRRVQTSAIRVALAATAAVAAIYLVIGVAVVILVTRDLTEQVDAQLVRALSFARTAPAPLRIVSAPPGTTPFGPPILVWEVAPDGTVSSSDPNATLLENARTISGPTNITIAGEEIRVRGADTDGGRRIIVGLDLSAVSRARATIIFAVAAIAPVLLGCVFLGAVAIGRRVAAPIELARQRQLEFTADASHELRTPLSVIEAQTSLALSHERSVDWYRAGFHRVQSESGRMRKLIEDLLWLARFDATREPPDAEPVDLGVLTAQAVDRFALVAETKRLALGFATTPGDHVVTAPPEWLDRLVGVLVDNACKYTPDGGRVDVTVKGAGGRVVLTVSDSGPGIPPAARRRIFDRFHRATTAAHGSGLGLAIANAIVRGTDGEWSIGTSSLGGASMSVAWHSSFGRDREPSIPRAARQL